MIRPFTNADREALVQLFRMNAPRYFDPGEEGDYIEYLNTHPESYFVYENAGNIWGAGGYHCTVESQGVISWFIIHPAKKGLGFGTSLVKYCLESLAHRPGITSVIVKTSQMVAPFFSRFGFHTREIMPNFWGGDLDLYLMELTFDYEKEPNK